MALLANAGVDAEVEIAVYSRAPDDEAISILFGKAQVTLDFYDVASLEQLRDVAAEGARRLRAVIEANARAGAAEDGAVAAADQPVELDADVLPLAREATRSPSALGPGCGSTLAPGLAPTGAHNDQVGADNDE